MSDENMDILRAIEIIKKENRASTAMLQRRMKIGFMQAARLMDTLQTMGIVTGPGIHGRKVLIK